MIALISDLHFCDGTATQGNVAPRVFELALGEIYGVASWLASLRDRPVHLDLVLLGDIFDLLRTERWFEDARGEPVPLAERPWGGPSPCGGGITPAVAARARAILAEILAKNEASLATIRGERLAPPPGVIVRRFFIPGNHDRLSLLDEGVSAGILGALGAVSGTAPGMYLHRVERPDHGLIARHGHEWDVWNFPGYRSDAVASEYTDDDYRATPIGDVVTVEMATRLPYELRARLADSRRFAPALVERLHQAMKRIEDVRPLFASFHWAFYAARRLGTDLDRDQARILRAALADTVRTIARSFRDLDDYQAWHERHHRPFHLDPALILRLILGGLSAPAGFPVEWIARHVEDVLARWRPISVTRQGALREDLARVGCREMRFVVYGHTHGPECVPLRGSARTQDVYLNTGTYRPGVFRAEGGRGFVGWQRATYVCIASSEEAAHLESPFGLPNVGPAFVSWTGATSAGRLSRAPASAGG